MAPVPVTSMNMFGYTAQPYSDVSSSARQAGQHRQVRASGAR